MTAKSSKLVSEAKMFALNYGDYPNGPEGAALTTVIRAAAAWNERDAAVFSDLFTINGSYLIGDVQLNGQTAIKEYFSSNLLSATAEGLRTEQVSHMLLLSTNAAVIVTNQSVTPEGGAGDPVVSVRSTWITQRVGGDWKILSYQSSPIRQ